MTVQERIRGTAPEVYRLRGTDFLLLDRAGAFADCGKTELLGGGIFCMNARHRPHARAKKALYDALRDALGATHDAAVMVEASVDLSAHDVPEPDILLATEPDGEGLVPGSSLRLVIGILDTTLADDLGRKAGLYARAAVPEYWVIDIRGHTIHQLFSPAADGYAKRATLAFGATIAARTIPALEVSTQAL